MPKRKFKESKKKADFAINRVKIVGSKSNVVLEDFGKNPSCPHGPQVCFEKDGRKFYSCSAFRTPKECQQNSERIRNKVSNSGIAQYLFAEDATEFLSEMMQTLELKNFLCLGTPSIHEKLGSKGLRSFLLDLDPDMIEKNPGTSAHYNMCNHYFFGEETSYKEFLVESKECLTVVMDPPFSAKPEILSYVHSLVENDWQMALDDPTLNLNYFWIAPYFLEGHIRKANSRLVMSDYQINYANHKTFSKGAKKSRKSGSPIRFFTNVPLSRIQLPQIDYMFCEICDKCVAKSNRHCSKCDDCTSKDGQTYIHCNKCSKCVKPTWTHCTRCRKCVLSAGHSC